MSDRKYGATSFQPADAQFHYARVRAAVAGASEQLELAPGLSAILVQVSWLEAAAAQQKRRIEIKR